MFEATALLFIYVETPLHPGSTRGLGAVDLPIQRERTTGYPIVQSSSLKGRLRAEAGPRLTKEEVEAIFGPESERAGDHAGALSTGDARLLLFPVRSLAGVFAWTTSVDLLARFRRVATLAGHDPGWPLPPEPGRSDVWVNGRTLVAGDSVVLEEFSFVPRPDHSTVVKQIGEWLASNALPEVGKGQDVYAYWRQALPYRLCVLPQDAFRDFVLYGTEIQTHVRLDPVTKTVQTGGLWTVESLPVDTVLYAPVMAGPSRKDTVKLKATEILQKVTNLRVERTQMGGDETTGQGMVALRFLSRAAT
jgi:CRISPR-associated protein Cmr4